MKLYSLPLSPFAARVRGAIYAKDLAVEIVSPPADWRTSAEYRAISPFNRVPALVLDDGSSLPESGVIVEYLEDAFPERPLRPATAYARARVRLITQVAELYVMGALNPLFGLFDSKERDTAAIDAALAKLDDALAKLDALLARGGYAEGDRLSTADVWLTPVRFTLDGLMGFSGRRTLLDRYPHVRSYPDVIQGDKVLSRVWGEMEASLKAFMALRAGAAS